MNRNKEHTAGSTRTCLLWCCVSLNQVRHIYQPLLPLKAFAALPLTAATSLLFQDVQTGSGEPCLGSKH